MAVASERPAVPDRRPVLGIAFALAAVSCFVVLDTTVKVLSASVSVLVVVWFRYLFQALGMTLVVLPMRGRRALRTRHPWLHVLRGLLMWSSSRLTRTEDPMVTHMFSGWVGMAVATALLPWVWQAIPGADLWALLLLAGAMSTACHFLLIKAYTQAST